MNDSTDFLSSPSFRYRRTRQAEHSNSSGEDNNFSGDSDETDQNGQNGQNGQDDHHAQIARNDPNDSNASQNQRFDELAGKLDFLDGELRRRVGELIDAGQRIAGMEKVEGELRTALKVGLGPHMRRTVY